MLANDRENYDNKSGYDALDMWSAKMSLQQTAVPGSLYERVTQSVAGRQEAARRHAVKAVMVIYILIMFEGVFRKYVFPEWQRYLIFTRDPVVLYLYAHALHNGLIKNSGLLTAGMGLALLSTFLVIVQATTGDIPLVIRAFGFRQYFLMIPLPFIMAEVLRHEDMQRFLRINLVCLIMIAPLMVAQVLSLPDSWVNTGTATDANLMFRDLRYGQFVRAPGFFTAALALAVFVDLAGALVIAACMMPKAMRPPRHLLAGGTFALLVALSVSGNRGALVGITLVMIGAAVSSVFLPSGSRAAKRAILVPLLLVILGLIISLVVFPDQYEALHTRWMGADRYGNFTLVFRALGDFVKFADVIGQTPLEGFGLGSGSNAFTILSAGASASIMPYVEADWSRHIVDLGPLLGIVYILYRVVFTFHLGAVSIAALRRHADPRSFLIFSAAGFQILYGTVSGQSTVGGLCWFAAGLILAAPRYARPFR